MTDGRRTERRASSLLAVDDIHTYYGSIQALKGITLEVHEGEIVTLIGSNGAGKSTTLRSISGLDAAAHGRDPLPRPRHLADCPPQEIVGLGISQSPEGRRCFQRMTVRENLELGAYLRRDDGIADDLDAGLRPVPAPARSARSRRRARCPAASSRCSPSAAR